jgi:hypothetical protein
MSKKTLLALAAFAELFLGAYFILAFFAWIAKYFLAASFASAPGKGSSFFPFILAIWIVLAASSFVLYTRTRRKIKNLAPDAPKELKSESKSESHQTTAA